MKKSFLLVAFCLILSISLMKGGESYPVDLRPSLPVGTYTIVRSIEIDPNNVWIDYGQEPIGTVTVLEDIDNAGVNVGHTGESVEVVKKMKEGITGSVINPLSEVFNKENLLFIWLGVITLLLVYQIFFRKRNN